MPHVIRTRTRAPQTPTAHPVLSPAGPQFAPPRLRSLAPARTAVPADAAAVAVLHRAARALLDDLHGLTDRLIAVLREREPVYRSAVEADAAEVRREVRDSLRHNIGSLIKPRESRDDACRTSWRIGAGRAEQGLPLDAVLHAFRLGGAMVWQGLVDETARRAPDDVRLLIHVAAEVWNFVDEHCALVADAYRQTERRMQRHRENRARLTAASLLDGTLRIADLAEAAATLDLPESGRYAVVVARPASGSPLPCPPLEFPAGLRVARHAAPGCERVIVLLGEGVEAARDTGRLPALAAGLDPPPGLRVGIGSAVSGLAALGDARRLAETALDTSPRGGGLALLEERLPAALVVSSPDLGAALAARVLGPLEPLDPADRDVLIDTLTAWLAADGSAQRAAARLYCHRNTVLNRLRRFEQLTGRCLSRPSDAVEVSLALDARRLLSG